MKAENTKPLIILTAGGTGGHVYPAEALAEEMEKRGYRLMLVTDKRGKDNYKGRLGQMPNRAVCSGGVMGKSVWYKGLSLFKIGFGVLQAIEILIHEKPQCVVGFGGYASFPACMGAILTGVPLVIHEQNSVMSRTNRFLSKYAALTAQSFRRVKYAVSEVQNVVCGMPVRAAIVDAATKPYPKLEDGGKMQILVLGGSQGARVFAQTVPEAVKLLPGELRQRLRIYQQCRADEEDEIMRAYVGTGVELTVRHFFDNMAELYANSHIVISRSGASSVSEIAVVGVPSILVPLPTAADDHQTTNAAEIAAAGAGVVVAQRDFVPAKLEQILEDWSKDYPRLQKMSKAAQNAAFPDAAKRLADAVEEQIKQAEQRR